VQDFSEITRILLVVFALSSGGAAGTAMLSVNPLRSVKRET
jgi:hypothetical protein